jgi:hypothetical protein
MIAGPTGPVASPKPLERTRREHMEHVLELQELDAPEVLDGHSGGGVAGSFASLLLCGGGSNLSLLTCD